MYQPSGIANKSLDLGTQSHACKIKFIHNGFISVFFYSLCIIKTTYNISVIFQGMYAKSFFSKFLRFYIDKNFY